MADITSINQGLDVTERVLNVGDYRKWMNLIMTFVIIILFVFITVFIVRKTTGNYLGNLWDFVSSPFKDLIERIRAQKEVAELGVSPTLKNEEAKKVADALYNCFQASGDDEDSFYSILQNRIANAADWELVKGAFGSRVSPKWHNNLTFLGHKHECNLEGMIADNFTDKEQKKVRDILKSKGITKINF